MQLQERLDDFALRYGQIAGTSLVWIWLLVELAALAFRPIGRYYFQASHF